jgi:1,4-alpha-glucan branching enzyme
VNFWGNNEYNDGFSYDNWGGYNLLAKLNQRNPQVKDYICDTIRFWVKEFDIDGLRLDAADVLDFDFMKTLRSVANDVKPDFWLMGEVIHGDYTRWVNGDTLHSVTNYVMHKGLYSGHNDHNYFEIAHTQRRLEGMGKSGSSNFRLYNFVDNHDVERIYTKLNKKAHFAPVHILLYTLPGIPSIYYGSEFAIEGRKERGSDASLRPALNYDDFKDAIKNNPATKLIAALGKIRQETPELSYGDYNELLLRNRKYAFSRNYNGRSIVVTVNNDDGDFSMTLPAGNCEEYIGALYGDRVKVNNGQINVNVRANSGEIWVPADKSKALKPIEAPQEITEAAKPQVIVEEPKVEEKAIEAPKVEETATAEPKVESRPAETVQAAPPKQEKTYEEGIIAGLQEAIIAIMEKNGPVTDQMRRDVLNNTHHDSLIIWVKSFR